MIYYIIILFLLLLITLFICEKKYIKESFENDVNTDPIFNKINLIKKIIKNNYNINQLIHD
jgi:hypothetical protein